MYVSDASESSNKNDNNGSDESDYSDGGCRDCDIVKFYKIYEIETCSDESCLHNIPLMSLVSLLWSQPIRISQEQKTAVNTPVSAQFMKFHIAVTLTAPYYDHS